MLTEHEEHPLVDVMRGDVKLPGETEEKDDEGGSEDEA